MKIIRIKLTCNECGKVWRVSPNSDPQCPKCNGVDYEVSE
jgi:Zn finger protein HypA/HybF involved in hydrogenase expression